MQDTHSSSSPVRSESTPPSQRGRFRLRDVPDEETRPDAGESAQQPLQAPQRHPLHGVSPSSHESDDLHAEEDVATRRSRVLLLRRTAPYYADVPDSASILNFTAANAPAAVPSEKPCDQRCGGCAGGAGAHQMLRAARAASPDTQLAHSTDGSAGLNGALESLARLLRAYVPPPSLPSTDGEGSGASRVDTAAGTAAAMYEKARQWCCFLPSCIDVPQSAPPPPPPSPPAAVTRAAAQPEHVLSSPLSPPQQLQRSARRHQIPGDRHHRAAYADFTHHVEIHQRLWFLLTQYPQDASGCLSLCFSLSHVLELMRQTPPPTLSLPRSPDFNDTCPCGCLIGGCFVDTVLHSFHRYYYRTHQSREEAHKKGHPQPREEGDDEQADPQHVAAVTAAPSLSSLQAALNSEIMPLLAVQILADFVWRCSEKYLSEQQSRASKQASLQARVHADVMKIIALNRKAEQPRRDRPPQLGGVRTEHSAVTQQRCSSADVCVSIGTASAAFAAAYKSFCPAPRNVWALIACVDLAWCQLEQYHALFFFAPQLIVLGRLQQSRADGQPHQWNVSALQEVAAEADLPPDVLEDLLHRRCAHSFDNSAAPKPHADALHHLRMRLLTQVHQPRCERGNEPGEGGSSDDAAQTPSQAELAEEELQRMEAFVCPLVGGRTAQMPPWCAVALEMQQLYSESRQRGRRVRQRTHDHRSAEAAASDAAEERMYCHQVRLLVRWLVRLLLLPTLRPKCTPSSCSISAEKSDSETPEAAAGAGTAGAGDAAWQENMSALSDWMMLHPLFGVAVAVASDVVPLYWAASCVIGTTFTTAAGERASGSGSSSSSTNEAVVAELERIGQRIRMWLRQGEERSREE